jgi:hypothetical protein
MKIITWTLEDCGIVDPGRLRDFWTFIAERQTIWHKRFVLKEMPPWTKDGVLRNFFFTNVYRDLDKGTIFYKENIATIKDPVNLVFATLIYRLFNQIPTYQYLKENDDIRYGNWNYLSIVSRLKKLEHNVFTGAFTVTGVRFGGFDDKISNVCWLIEQLMYLVPRIVKELGQANNLKDVFDIIVNLEGFGKFLAYEVTIDLAYTHLNKGRWTEDDWVNPGPGCKRGIQYIFPTRFKPYERIIEHLRWHQNRYFKIYGLNFPAWEGRELTLRSIEHSLCEFSKYARVKYGQNPDGSRSRSSTRRYSPKQSNLL